MIATLGATEGLKLAGFETYGLAQGIPALQMIRAAHVSRGFPKKLAS